MIHLTSTKQINLNELDLLQTPVKAINFDAENDTISIVFEDFRIDAKFDAVQKSDDK